MVSTVLLPFSLKPTHCVEGVVCTNQDGNRVAQFALATWQMRP
jgi:hypothetical protein